MNIRQMERLAYDLDQARDQELKRKADAEKRLEELGIVNRATARRAGLRNPKKQRRMKVPK